MSTTEETPVAQEAPAQKTPAQETPAQAADESSLEKAQVDGSGSPGNGSQLADTEFSVEVKLADLQADPNNPLFSAKSFEELQL
jgi:ATP-dependent RNA helicase DDX19/DBP5